MQVRANMERYSIGDIERFSKTVGESDVYLFAGIVGDFYGVHLNEEFAKQTRFGKRIARGALSIGFIATVMGYLAGRAEGAGAVSYRYDITFRAPVFIGETVTAQLELVEKNLERSICIFKATVLNQDGVTVADGQTYLKVL